MANYYEILNVKDEASLLMNNDAHFNSYDFLKNSSSNNDLYENIFEGELWIPILIANIINANFSQHELNQAFFGFAKLSEVGNCEKPLKDVCLVMGDTDGSSHSDYLYLFTLA